MFHLLLLQLDPSFNIQALDSLVTPEAMDATIAEAKDKVVASQEGVADEGTTSEEATYVAATEGTSSIIDEDATAEEVPKGEEVN